MKHISFYVLLLFAFFITQGCLSSKGGHGSGHGSGSGHETVLSNIKLPDIDNSKYELRCGRITIQGIDKSRSLQMSRDKAYTNAQTRLKDTVEKCIDIIVKKRQLKNVSMDGLTIWNTADIDEESKYGKDADGKTVYYTTRILQFDIEPILKGIYKKLAPPQNYSWFAFCRDFDYLMDLKNK